MQGTIEYGSSIEGFIEDTQIIIDDLEQTLESIERIMVLYNDNIYSGTAYDQIIKFTDSLYMQICKLKTFYELAKKYMENTVVEVEITNKKMKSLISSISTISPKSKGEKWAEK